MASKKGKSTVANSQSRNQPPSAPSSTLDHVKSTELSFCAKFLHGSPDSRDRDCVYVIDSSLDFPSHATLVDFCKSDIEDRNVIQLAEENPGSGDWYVKRSHRGPPDEVNNAILETHRNEPDGASYQLLVTQKACRSVILRYVIAAKAIIVKMRRIDACRTQCLPALASWSFSSYLDTIHNACARQFDALTYESAKYVAFHLGQSYLLSNGLESYTKHDLVTYLPELRPIVYFEGQPDDTIPKAFASVITALEVMWHAQTSRIFASTILDKRLRLQSFHLLSDGAPLVARNYLEVDCGGVVLDMTAERLIGLGSPIPLQIPISVPESASIAPGCVLQMSPTWRNGISLVDLAQSVSQAEESQRFIFGVVEGEWRVFSDTRPMVGSNSGKTKSKANAKVLSGHSKPIKPDEATQTAIKLVLDRLGSLPFPPPFSLSVDISRGNIIRETARSMLTLLETKV